MGTRPLAQEPINNAESRLWWFIAAMLLAYMGLVAIARLKFEWVAGHVLWLCGAGLIIASVLHSRHFDVLKTANPRNQEYNPANRGSMSRRAVAAEKVLKHIWLLGFALVGMSRWIPL